GSLIFESSQKAHRFAVGRWVLVLTDEEGAREQGYASIGVEEREGERSRGRTCAMTHLLHLQAILDLLGRGGHWLGEPRIDARNAPHKPARRERRMLCGLHCTRASTLAAPSFPFDAGDVDRAAMHGVVHAVGGWL